MSNIFFDKKNIRGKIAVLFFPLLIVDIFTKFFFFNYGSFELNNGVSFSLFSSFGNTFWLILNFVILLFLGILFIANVRKMTVIESYSVVLVLAGGLGNVISRFLWNGVVDWIKIPFFIKIPTFNIADVLIDVGIAIIIINLFISLFTKNDRKK
ncbi:signal peptidase II [Candidatus Dojkabacteria bacterium]|nr:signal peptidase II [Candidatus Dojkabacteria bacterium]